MKHYLHLLVLFAILSLVGCGNKQTNITKLAMLEGGKTFACATGTVADQFVFKRFPDAKIEYYNTVLDCALAVKGGKADAAVYDLPILKNIAGKNGGLRVLSELLSTDQYGFAVQPDSTGLKVAMDAVLAEIKSDGTYDDMMKRWFPDKGSPAPMPELNLTGGNGVLKFGTAAVSEPMSFVDANRKVVGFDIEYASYVARKLGKRLEIINMEFGAMIPALISGKVDMIGAGLSITEERKKKVLFSECYYPNGIAAMVKGEAAAVPVAAGGKMKTADDISDKTIGVLLGSMYDTYATRKYPQAKIPQYQSVSDLLIALNSGKIDVTYMDQSLVPEVLKANSDLGILAKDVFSVPIGAGFNADNDALREQFNAFLKEIRSNGVYQDMVTRWVDKGIMEMPKIESTKTTNGVLRAGVVNDLGMPFGLVRDGKVIGFDIELSSRFAAWLGRDYAPVPLQFGSLIASISTNKIDIITASMFITEEREKMIDFSDPYYESGVSLIARKENIEQAPAGRIATVDDLADKKIGIFTGTIFDGFIANKYPKAEIFRYENTADLMLSVKTGKIDAAMFDLVTARLILKHNPELKLLSDQVLTMPLGVGFHKNNPALRKEFNDFLKEARADGAYDTMSKRWFLEDAEEAVMPVFPKSSSDKKLVAGVSVDDLPYVAVMKGDFVGFDIEMIRKFAERKNYDLEIVTMEFPSLIAALAAGKVDLITDGIAISEERGKQIDFSDPYAELRSAVVVAAKSMAGYSGGEIKAVRKPFLKRLSDSFYSNIILEKRYLLIIDGLLITLLISIFAAILGTFLGGLICFMKMSKNKILTGSAELYITLLRGTPVLVLLMIIYYIVFASVNINPAIVAVFAFSLNFGAYVSEMFRTSIESIDKGQKEAGIAGGFTKVQTFLHIITPQALRHLLPVYKGEFISLVKMTSIVGYIAVQDLTKASDIIRSRTFDAFFPLIMAAVLYLLIAWLLTRALGYIEVSVDPKRKRLTKEVEAIS
ncbi:MAG: ABC transporter permease subunit [Bacteroidia bacterium]|nr:ABC transporter permease subunit [Bacteroidia bacterium]